MTKQEPRDADVWTNFLLLFIFWAVSLWLWAKTQVLLARTHARLGTQATKLLTDAEAHTTAAIDAMREETSRAQGLALKVGVATAVVSALVGAFAGAWAAHVIG